ncbi:hypothetical protein DMUE_5638 [Dictyocoela muelleri]|nr:hypothetical protein DMUE_5638 [Dictyocoela muelleri]
MSFKNLYSSKNTRTVSGKSKGRSNNLQDAEGSYASQQEQKDREKSFNAVLETSSEKNSIWFKRMMNEEIMNINFYMLEGIRNFESFTLREKISTTLQKCEIKLQEAFFKKIGKNKDFSSWDGFKIFVSEYCLRKSIECMQKYTDEKLSDYIERLISYAAQHDIEEAEVID